MNLLYDEKRQCIKIGDEIVFFNTKTDELKITDKLEKTYIYLRILLNYIKHYHC